MNHQFFRMFANYAGIYVWNLWFFQADISNFQMVVFAITLWAVNLIIKPLLLLITLPFTIVTLGLFVIIINTWMVMIASRMLAEIASLSFLEAFLLMLIIFGMNWILKKIIEKDQDPYEPVQMKRIN